jgi:hypothetical protein
MNTVEKTRTNTKAILLSAASLFVVASVAPTALAHFRLLEPTSWVVEDNLGNPQKMGPCGGTGSAGDKLTGVVTKVVGGSTLHIKVQETVFHVGFYRVALAVNSRSELPPDAEAVTTTGPDGGPRSMAAKIVYPPQPPVLADGLFQHMTRNPDAWETDVQMPNINCTKCTLQIAEFMANHALNKPGDFTYHHCADLAIKADASKAIDAAWPSQSAQK